MNSSGMKRGLAATAISALAVTGLPFLATSASATPLSGFAGGDDQILFYSPVAPVAPAETTVSNKNDGTNNTVSLVVGGGKDVTSVQFLYDSDMTVGETWVNIPGSPVARGANGTFNLDWASGNTAYDQIKAIAGPSGDEVEVNVDVDNTAETVELGTEGTLGVFQSPYGAADTVESGDPAPEGQYVVLHGTTSNNSGNVLLDEVGQGVGAQVSAPVSDADGAGSGTTGTFRAIYDIAGYVYDGNNDQIAFRADHDTTDAESSTLRRQRIASISADPASQNAQAGTGEIVLTVTGDDGNPVPNAQVGIVDGDDNGTPNDATDDTDLLLGYTDENGELDYDAAAGSYTFFANTTNDDAYQAAIDPSDTATVTEYEPVTDEVIIKNVRNRTNFDIDELDNGDDFTIETRDQNGNLYDDATAPRYRWVIDPTGTAPAVEGPWRDATATATDGVWGVTLLESDNGGDPLPAGSYRLEAERPVDPGTGTGRVTATPVTVNASESEITFAEGESAGATSEGDTTIDGKLANAGGGLAGRVVTITYNTGFDSGLAPQSEQPAGVDVTPDAGGIGASATAITGEGGAFAVKLSDPEGPVVVPDAEETGTLTAEATQESSSGGTTLRDNAFGGADSATANDPANAMQSIEVNWRVLPAVSEIDVDIDNLAAGSPAPGKPVQLSIEVFGDEDGNPNNDDTEIQDYPVTVSVDKGFLTPAAQDDPDTDDGDADTTADDESTTIDGLTLAEGHDAEGDLYGFYEQLGGSQDISTGDNEVAMIAAAIEQDADFADDGLATMEITVTAGDKTVTEEVQFDVRNYLNLVNPSLERAEGEPAGDVTVGDTVDFNLFAEDQFGNLVGDQLADISDDSTVAEVVTDGPFGRTETDFATDQPGISATSAAETVQTLMARMNAAEALVDEDGNADEDFIVLTEMSEPINWVAAPVLPSPELDLEGNNNGGKADRLKADAEDIAAGSTVKLFKKTKNGWKKIREGVLNGKGNMRFKVADKNGKKVTVYRAKVEATDAHTADRDSKRVR